MADHAHIFWGCPVLKPFWEGVHSNIREYLSYDTKFTCLSFYLGSMDSELPKNDRYFLKIFVAASKKAINAWNI